MTGAVLFDLDNTLHDFVSSCRVGLRELVRAFPDDLGGIPLDDLFSLYIRLLEETFQAYLRGETTKESARAKRIQALFARFGRGLDLDEAAEAYRLYRAAYVLARRPFPEAQEVLQTLRRTHRLAIVSNGTWDEQEACARQIGVRPLVEFVLTPDQGGRPKPAPDMICTAAERLGVDLRHVTMVGDSWEADVAAALAAGVRGVWADRWGRKCPEPGRVPVVRDLRELLVLLHA